MEWEGEGAGEGLFFASPSPPPQRNDRKRPEDEMEVLVEEAKKVKALTPAIANFLKRNNGNRFAYLSLVNRQVELIKGRSQEFGDAQITIFDKALLQLSQNGKEVDNPVVMQFFAEHFLGSNIDGKGRPASAVEAGRVIERAVQVGYGVKVQERLLKDKQGQRQGAGAGAQQAHGHGHAQRPAARGTGKKKTLGGTLTLGEAPRMEMGLASLPLGSNTNDHHFARLWELYGQAKQDFIARSNNNTPDQLLPVAKFLRDTAENFLEYLKDKHVDADMKAELLSTYNTAKTTVVSLTGGKKRKFDVADLKDLNNLPSGPRIGMGTGLAAAMGTPGFDSADRNPTRREFGSGFGRFADTSSGLRGHDMPARSGGTFAAADDDRGMRYTHGHPSPDFDRGRTGGVGYTAMRGRDCYRPGRQRSVSPRRRSVSPARRRGARDDLPMDEQRPARGNTAADQPRAPSPVPVRGRGHSNFPYGYSRQVDSYQPGKEGRQGDYSGGN